MIPIKFGTDGWRAIIAQEYTLDNLSRVSDATARWMVSKGMSKVVIGHDTRFGGKMFADRAAEICLSHGLTVYLGEDFVSTPMVSLGIVKHSADLGIVITASHNPPSYNGFKLKSAYGGPTIPKEIAEVESHIVDVIPTAKADLNAALKSGKLIMTDLESIYIDHIKSNFDLDLIRNSGIKLAYDAMYGAGQNVVKQLFDNAALLHCENNPSFYGQAPEPISRNLTELSQYIKDHPEINVGLANDGDADRVGMFDADGEFVDSQHLLLLLLYYLKEYKNETGKVVVTFSVTEKMEKLAEMYGLDFEVTKIGFKYIAEIMVNEKIIAGGEESGGLAVAGHIPERDGIWIGLLIMEFMAKTGRSIKELIQEVYTKVGAFKFDRDDLHIENDKKWAIMDLCKEDKIKSIGGRDVLYVKKIDGYKFFVADNTWVMIRPSGTEPVLRVYAQAGDYVGVRKMLNDTHATLAELVK
jgi:phosphomannomutase